ncbi:uncharacterized protein BXZ73DRAFT_54616 [Epithele typhae]|uniref:uncharacterized protein n=1 Tax=Epithele typhae TaxID=378194 RepID=UPI0020083B22|nr:uncharacterized protein BXZ73DRAFT_54616 [Epithele typhae]KAH9914914.1 hypothetical protein BXZ73DRAFT_54616 [Epithele typhae]
MSSSSDVRSRVSVRRGYGSRSCPCCTGAQLQSDSGFRHHHVLTTHPQIATEKQRPMLLGAMGGVYAICSVAGPIIGGALSQHVTWRFILRVTQSALSAVELRSFLSSYACPISRPPIRVAALVGDDWTMWCCSQVAMVTLLLLPLQWGGNTRPWSDPVVIALLVVAGCLVVVFVVWEHRQGSRALLPIKMILTGSMLGICLEAVRKRSSILTHQQPLFYQVKGSSAEHSGVNILPFMIMSCLRILAHYSPPSRLQLTGHVWPFLLISPALAAVGGGLLFTVGLGTDNAKLIGYQILLGCGLGAAIQNTIVTGQAQYVDSPEMISQATGLVTFMQLLGASIGLA